MKTIGFMRNIDGVGRIVIPKDIKSALRWETDDLLEIFVDMEKERVNIQKVYDACLCYSATENLKEIRPRYMLCRTCIEKFAKE